MNQRDNSKAVSESCSAALQSVELATGFVLLVKPGDCISQLLLRDGVFEPAGTDLVTRLLRPGDVCVDAGCHVGYYTCLFAHLVGPTGYVYAFDANPESCLLTRRNLEANHLENAEVTQAALGDQQGSTTFYVSTDDQTGLSSLGPIPRHKEAIAVPWLRLQDFLRERRIPRVRLLKLDVEGAEEIVLRGLTRFLKERRIDLVLIECYDERLELLNTSTEKVAGLLHEAGYQSWEFGTLHPSGWSITPEVRSRGDSNYLFAQATARDGVPTVSLAGALLRAQGQRDAWENKLQSAQQAWQEQVAHWQQQVAKLEEDIAWLLDSLRTREEAAARLGQEKSHLETVLNAIEKSAGWRMLNRWRQLRDRLAPEHSRRRRLYDASMSLFRRNEP